MRNYYIYICSTPEGQPLLVSQTRWSEGVVWGADEEEVKKVQFTGAPELEDYPFPDEAGDGEEWTELVFVQGSELQQQARDDFHEVMHLPFCPILKPSSSGAAGSTTATEAASSAEKRRRTVSPAPADEDFEKVPDDDYDEEGEEEESCFEADVVISDDPDDDPDDDDDEYTDESEEEEDSDDNKTDAQLWEEYGVEIYETEPTAAEVQYWQQVLHEKSGPLSKGARSIQARIKRAKRDTTQKWLNEKFGMSLPLKDVSPWIAFCPWFKHFSEYGETIQERPYLPERQWANERRKTLKSRKQKQREADKRAAAAERAAARAERLTQGTGKSRRPSRAP